MAFPTATPAEKPMLRARDCLRGIRSPHVRRNHSGVPMLCFTQQPRAYRQLIPRTRARACMPSAISAESRVRLSAVIATSYRSTWRGSMRRLQRFIGPTRLAHIGQSLRARMRQIVHACPGQKVDELCPSTFLPRLTHGLLFPTVEIGRARRGDKPSHRIIGNVNLHRLLDDFSTQSRISALEVS